MTETERKFFKVFEIPQVPITSDIILGIIEIVLKQEHRCNFCFQDYEEKIYRCDTGCNYDNGFDMYYKYIGFGGNKTEALLNLCMKLPEIKPQVQALFN